MKGKIEVIRKSTVSETRLHSGTANVPPGYRLQSHAKPETAQLDFRFSRKAIEQQNLLNAELALCPLIFAVPESSTRSVRKPSFHLKL